MNMGGTVQSPDAYQEIIPLMSNVTYAIADLLQKAPLSLVLSMSCLTICNLFRGIGTNEVVNRKERSRRVCGSIYPDANVVVNRLFGETRTKPTISQQIYELCCSLSPDDTTLRSRAALNALVARIIAIAKENKNQFSQTCHARLTTRPKAFSGISFIGAELSNIADEKRRQA